MKRKFRRTKPTKHSILQGYQISLITLILLISLMILLLFLISIFDTCLPVIIHTYIPTLTNNLLPLFQKVIAVLTVLTKIIIVVIGVNIFILIITLLDREKFATFSVEDMNRNQFRISRKIRKLFTDKQISDVLKLSNDTRFGFEMPEIHVWISKNFDHGYVAVENIMNFNVMDAEKYEERLSGIFTGKFQKYAIVSSHLSKDSSFMIFLFEDMTTSQRFIINNLNDIHKYVSENHNELKLSKNLTWYVDKTPHLSVIARTRAGKSIFAGKYLAELMSAQGWTVEYNSAKLDVNVKKFNGKHTAEEIVMRAEYWCEIMDERLRIINEHDADIYTSVEFLSNVGLFFDEIGNLNGMLELDRNLKKRWETSINRLTATGGSAGIHIISISQFATKEAFLPSTARVNSSDAVIMLGSAADSASERQYLMPGFAELPKRNYGVGEGIARFNSSGSLWETPHYFEAPWINLSANN